MLLVLILVLVLVLILGNCSVNGQIRNIALTRLVLFVFMGDAKFDLRRGPVMSGSSIIVFVLQIPEYSTFYEYNQLGPVACECYM